MDKEVRFYKDKEGRTQATMAESEKLEDELCDFCSRKNPPFKIYPCRDFCHPDAPQLWSRGEWNACHTCADLIDANDRQGLSERCALMLAFNDGDYRFEPMRSFHEAFFKNRI